MTDGVDRSPSTRGRIIVDQGVVPTAKGPQPLDRVAPMQHCLEGLLLVAFNLGQAKPTYSSEDVGLAPIVVKYDIVASFPPRPATLRLKSGEDIATDQASARAGRLHSPVIPWSFRRMKCDLCHSRNRRQVQCLRRDVAEIR